MFRAWLELARISNLPTVWTNVLAGWLLAGGAWEWVPLTWLLVGGSLLYTAGMILNDAFDVKFDREHRRERPIPSGRISARAAWITGILMLAGGVAMCWLGAGAGLGWVMALVAAILAYDAYHKPWAGSVLIMGACRTLLYCVAGSAVTGSLGWQANHELVVKAVALGAYIVGVSLVARSEAKRGGDTAFGSALGWLCLSVPGLAKIGLMLHGGSPYQCGPALLVFSFVVWRAGRILRGGPSAIGRAVGWLLAGIVVVDALAVTGHAPLVELCFMLSMPFLLLWQRKISAT